MLRHTWVMSASRRESWHRTSHSLGSTANRFVSFITVVNVTHDEGINNTFIVFLRESTLQWNMTCPTAGVSVLGTVDDDDDDEVERNRLTLVTRSD
jgi:hypothetical protein